MDFLDNTIAADTAIDALPLRGELRGKQAYGAPQLDVAVALNTNENPYPPSQELIDDLVAEITKFGPTLNRYPERDAVELRHRIAGGGQGGGGEGEERGGNRGMEHVRARPLVPVVEQVMNLA